MSAPARSVFLFSLYLIVVCASIAAAPNAVLRMLSVAPTKEPWLQILGIVGVALGYYYLSAARAEEFGFIRATVWGRLGAASAYLTLIGSGMAPPQLALFAAADLGGALWTGLALRRYAPLRAVG